MKIDTALFKELDAIAKSNAINPRWSSDEFDILRRYKGKVTAKGIVEMLKKACGSNRSIDSVNKKLQHIT